MVGMLGHCGVVNGDITCSFEICTVWQIEQTLSSLGLHCLCIHFCPNMWGHCGVVNSDIKMA